jgi:hypothetical protein
MSFSIEIAPAKDATGASVHTVVVTIDDHETVLTFDSEEKAKALRRRRQEPFK